MNAGKRAAPTRSAMAPQLAFFLFPVVREGAGWALSITSLANATQIGLRASGSGLRV